jgi:O-acetyl-ADP-ribose deacetylase (regulator of RNase III)
VEHGLATVAFPSISTGAYRFPIDRAAPIALGTVAEVLHAEPSLTRVVFCCFSARDLDAYHAAAAQVLGAAADGTR